MKHDVLYATGLFDIGDSFLDDHGNVQTVTDIQVTHYVGKGLYKVLYEVNNSGEYLDLRLRGFHEMPGVDQTSRKNNKVVQFPNGIKSTENDPFGFHSDGE